MWRMRKYGFENEYGSSLEYGLKFLEYPTFSYGHEIVEETEIAGKENCYMEHTGCYEDTVITNSMEFTCNSLSEYESEMRKIRSWLKRTKKVIYTDLGEQYFVVKRVEIEEKRAFHCIGLLTVYFICEPAVYLVSGDQEYSISDVLSNPYSICHPLYIVSGHYGSYKLIVNGNTVEVYVSSSDGSNSTPTYIDTEKMMTYTENGMRNTYLTGDYESLYLQEGENTIETPKSTSGLSMGYTPTVKVIPRWRCI